MSRINIRYHKKQFPFILNSFSTAIQKCKYYPLMMSGYAAQQARMHAKLDEIILETCVLSSIPYEEIRDYIKKRSIEGPSSISVAYDLRERVLKGIDLRCLINQSGHLPL